MWNSWQWTPLRPSGHLATADPTRNFWWGSEIRRAKAKAEWLLSIENAVDRGCLCFHPCIWQDASTGQVEKLGEQWCKNSSLVWGIIYMWYGWHIIEYGKNTLWSGNQAQKMDAPSWLRTRGSCKQRMTLPPTGRPERYSSTGQERNHHLVFLP